jgi:hypothetical protein
MGELVDFAAYKKQKEEQEEIERLKKEQEELDATLDEMDMLKRILEDVMKDLPEVKPSIMYVPIEPKLDAFMSKTLDGYLEQCNIELPPIDNDETDET